MDFGTANSPNFVAVGDFNGDGKLDVVTANQGNDTVSVLLGNGDGTFQPHVDYAVGDAPGSMAVGDFNGDGNLDLAVVNFNTGTVSILLGRGDGTFEPQVQYNAGIQPVSVAVGDFNGDGKLDLAVASFYGSTVEILLGNGDGTFKPHVDYATGPNPYSIAAGDLNGDGTIDLAVAEAGGSTAGVLLGNGDGTFQPREGFAAGSNPIAMTVGDFNRDGRLDLAMANPQPKNHTGIVSVLLQAPTVSFSNQDVRFADQLIGTSSTTQSVTLTNSGYLTLNLASLNIAGVEATDFSQTHTCGSSLPPGTGCRISITFKPTRIGQRSASVAITDNGVGSPQSFAVSGAGVVSGPNVTLSSNSLTFIPQLLGTTSAGQLIALNNYGTASLTKSIAASGDFIQTNNCGQSIAPGAGCGVIVTFKPTGAGPRGGALSITDNAPGSPHIVSLNGTGALNTTVSLVPSSMAFGCGRFGCSPPQKATLTNSGSSTLYIFGISITMTRSGWSPGGSFSQTNTCGPTLGPGQSCAISVTGGASFGRKVSGTLYVSDTGADSPQTISLRAAGVGPP